MGLETKRDWATQGNFNSAGICAALSTWWCKRIVRTGKTPDGSKLPNVLAYQHLWNVGEWVGPNIAAQLLNFHSDLATRENVRIVTVHNAANVKVCVRRKQAGVFVLTLYKGTSGHTVGLYRSDERKHFFDPNSGQYSVKVGKSFANSVRKYLVSNYPTLTDGYLYQVFDSF
jgi:hypothetical protein